MNTAPQKNQIARINRRLSEGYHKVFTSTPRERFNLGDHHLVDTYCNALVDSHLDLDWFESEGIKRYLSQ